MSTHSAQNEINEVYFCTFTCYKWYPLISQSNSYDAVYKWFGHLHKKRCWVCGYVIMPNHVHTLLHPTRKDTSINFLVGEGKRFIAYDIVSNFQTMSDQTTLDELRRGVSVKERKKNKVHQVFRPSFDARACFNEWNIEQKLEYMHANPVSGKWRLADDSVSYPYSSARFYELGEVDPRVSIVHYKDLDPVG